MSCKNEGHINQLSEHVVEYALSGKVLFIYNIVHISNVIYLLCEGEIELSYIENVYIK